MKLKLIVIGLIAFCSTIGYGQGNLQFNEVKYLPFTLTQTSTTVVQETQLSVTVPVNKVWKIEAACSNSINSINGASVNGKMMIDARIVFDGSGSGSLFAPLWLPAGTYVFSLRALTTSSSTFYTGYFSVIEFNVVP